MCNDDICISSNKVDLTQAIRVSHTFLPNSYQFFIVKWRFQFLLLKQSKYKVKKALFCDQGPVFLTIYSFSSFGIFPQNCSQFFIIWQYLQFLLLKRSKYKVEKVLFFDQRQVLKKLRLHLIWLKTIWLSQCFVVNSSSTSLHCYCYSCLTFLQAATNF